MRGFSVENLSDVGAAALEKNPNVELVEPIRYLHTDGVQTLPNDGGSFQCSSRWGLDRLDEGASPTFNGQYSHYYTGSGVHLYIVDSGINASHSESSGRIGTGYGNMLVNGLGYVTPNSDQIGHGTAVAALAAGTTFGLAKNATIHSVRIDDNVAGGVPCDVVVDRLNWVRNNAQFPAVVNLSYGGIPNCFAVETAITNVIAAGITMAKSAGNDTVDAFQDRGNRPANLIVVGAANQIDAKASFSNFGPYLALFAPGVSELTAGIGSNTDSVFFSGTSGAAPMAAGAAAILLQNYTSYTPAQVRSMLVGNASNVTIGSGGSGSPNKILYSNLP
jgi:subtilisin family serine protease